MYLAFIDESGTIEEKDPQSKFYVLTAMVMQEKGMKFLQRSSQFLKKDIWNLVQGKKKSIPRDFELHMKEILAAKKFFKPLRGNKEKTEWVLTKIYDYINQLYVSIISIIIVKENFYAKYEEKEMIKWALRLLIERINEYVRIDSQGKDDEYALLIMDENFTQDNEKRDFISEMMELGVRYNRKDVDKVLDTPIFLNSKFHNGIQIIDALAYLMYRYTHKTIDQDASTLFDELSPRFLKRLYPKFYGVSDNPRGIIEKGIKFFPSIAPESYWEVFKENNR